LGSASDGVAELFGACGTVVELEEERFDLGTAVTGCMPGYVGRLVEAFADAGVARGLSRDAAVQLAAAGVHGAAAYVAAAGDPAAVAAAVGSPGSMTAAGIAALEAHDIRGTVDAAVDAAVAEASRLA
jgi:pyrroline-5-carboxylate reductase